MGHPHGKFLAWLARSPARNLGASIAAGVFTGVVEYIAHTTLVRAHLPRNLPSAVDAAIIALMAALLVYTLLRQWRLRRAMVVRELNTVAELNHQVRNALQTIVYSQYVQQQDQARAVLESVDRIAKTLNEVFPDMGATHEERRAVGHSPVPEKSASIPEKSASAAPHPPRR
jgi:hypothetical protein